MAREIEQKELQQHLRDVARAVLRGRLIPFLGAGVNLCEVDAPHGTGRSERKRPPSGRELAQLLAVEFGYPLPEDCPAGICRPPELDLARISQYGETRTGAGPVREALDRVLKQAYEPNQVHRFIAGLPAPRPDRAEDNFPLVVTTNYDDLMEEAFRRAGQEFDLVFYGPDPTNRQRARFWHSAPGTEPVLLTSPNDYEHVFFEQRPVLLKVHGSVDRASEEREAYVITEDHYIEYLAAEPLERLLPPRILLKLREKHHLLFLGYSLRDWNFRVFLRRLKWGIYSDYQSWAVLLGADETDKKFWLKNNVDILWVELSSYVQELGLAIDRLREARDA